MSPRIVDMAPGSPEADDRRDRILALQNSIKPTLPKAVGELVELLASIISHALSAGILAEQYRELEAQIHPRDRVALPATPAEALRLDRKRARRSPGTWTSEDEVNALARYDRTRDQLAALAQFRKELERNLDGLIRDRASLDTALKAAQLDLGKIIPDVGHWLNQQRSAWAQLWGCMEPTLGRTPGRFDYHGALPGIRAIEETVRFLTSADYSKTPKPRKKRKTPITNQDRPLTLKETTTLNVVGRHEGNIAAAARELNRSPKTVRENYARAMKKLNRITGGKSRSASTKRIPEDKRGQANVSDDRARGG